MVKELVTKVRRPKLSLDKKTVAFLITFGLVVTTICFILWVWLTVVPVFVIETKYQLKAFMRDVLHAETVAEFFKLDFSGLNMEGATKHRQYGIVIPKVFVNEAAVFNVDANNKLAYTQALKQGIAHASGTAFPDTGGLGYYFAHSTSAEFRNQLKAVFYLLGKLEKNDDIYIWFENTKHHYQVTETKVTSPSDISFLDQTYDNETIVLQTCWPPGSTRERLLVFAQRVK